MTEAAAGKPPRDSGISPARFRANIGLAMGLAIGLVLALAEVTVAVRFDSGEGQRPKYRVVLPGLVVFRYPEDGELYRMRPVPQARAVREQLVWASTLAVGLLGWLVGYAQGRLAVRWSRPPVIR